MGERQLRKFIKSRNPILNINKVTSCCFNFNRVSLQWISHTNLFLQNWAMTLFNLGIVFRLATGFLQKRNWRWLLCWAKTGWRFLEKSKILISRNLLWTHSLDSYRLEFSLHGSGLFHPPSTSSIQTRFFSCDYYYLQLLDLQLIFLGSCEYTENCKFLKYILKNLEV